MEKKKESLSKYRIDIPTINQEHRYYYPEEKVKEFVKKEDVDLAEFLSNKLEYSPELIGHLIKKFRSKNVENN